MLDVWYTEFFHTFISKSRMDGILGGGTDFVQDLQESL